MKFFRNLYYKIRWYFRRNKDKNKWIIIYQRSGTDIKPQCKYCGKEMDGLEGMPVDGIDPSVCWKCLEEKKKKK